MTTDVESVIGCVPPVAPHVLRRANASCCDSIVISLSCKACVQQRSCFARLQHDALLWVQHNGLCWGYATAMRIKEVHVVQEPGLAHLLVQTRNKEIYEYACSLVDNGHSTCLTCQSECLVAAEHGKHQGPSVPVALVSPCQIRCWTHAGLCMGSAGRCRLWTPSVS